MVCAECGYNLRAMRMLRYRLAHRNDAGLISKSCYCAVLHFTASLNRSTRSWNPDAYW